MIKFKDKIIIIDDFIEKDYQEKIKVALLGAEDHRGLQFPWYYIEDVTAAYQNNSQHRPGLSHQYVMLPDELTGEDDVQLEYHKVGKVMSEYHELFIPMLQRVGFKFGISDVKVLQGRSFLQFPVNTDGTIDSPHIDIIGSIDYIVALYYVCDSDGDTVIYKEREENLEGKYTVKERVTPKKGRLVIFDGALYHAAEQPINSNTRCIVNYNLRI